MSVALASAPQVVSAEPMPRLSVDLPLHDPRECAQCGEGEELEVWQEHDEHDRPEPIYLVLCAECAGVIIEPHPRLYRKLPTHAPAHGAMPICWNCRWRAGTSCQHAQSRARGGRGLRLDMPSPTWGHMRTRRDPQTGSRSKTFVLYHGPVWGCDGKKL